MRIGRYFVASLAMAAVVGCDGSSAPRDEHPGHGHEEHGDHHAEQGHDEEGRDEVGHEEHEDVRRVEIDPDVIESANIEATAPKMGSLRDNVRATAVVKHDVNRVAHIAPMVEGQISAIRAQLGDEVESGQTLAIMRSVALGEARANVQDARATREVAQQNFERQKRLVEKGIGAQRTFIEAKGALEQAEARLQATRSRMRALGVSGGNGSSYPLRSHIDGTIIEQHASIGETKNPQDELFVVADQSIVWVIGQVPEQDAFAVRKGMEATVALDAYPDQSWSGTVDWIASTIDTQTRLLPIRVELENPKGRLKPGMFGAVQLSVSDSDRNVPLVPVDAVQRVDGENHVFVAGEHEGEFVARPVRLGAESSGLVEVVEGLGPDARVVSRGAFEVKATLTASGRSAAHHH